MILRYYKKFYNLENEIDKQSFVYGTEHSLKMEVQKFVFCYINFCAKYVIF